MLWMQGTVMDMCLILLPNPSAPADHHSTLCFRDIYKFGNTFLNKQWLEEEITSK